MIIVGLPHCDSPTIAAGLRNAGDSAHFVRGMVHACGRGEGETRAAGNTLPLPDTVPRRPCFPFYPHGAPTIPPTPGGGTSTKSPRHCERRESPISCEIPLRKLTIQKSIVKLRSGFY